MLDRCRDRGDGLQLAINVNVAKLRDELDSRAGMVESDMCRVHDEDKAADVQLRSELNARSAVLSAGHDQLTNSVATLAVKLGKLQGAGQISRPRTRPRRSGGARRSCDRPRR